MTISENAIRTISLENSALKEQLAALQQRFDEANEALDAIRSGSVDALVISREQGEIIYTLQGVEYAYRVLIELINEGALTMVEDGTILYCNQRFAEMLNTPLETVIGSSIFQYIPFENQAVFLDLFKQGLAQSCRGDITLLRKGGTRLQVMVSLNAFTPDQVREICMVAADLTERKKAEEKLESALQKEQAMRLQLIQAEKHTALSRMMASVAHEINNPVQTIKNCMFLIKSATPADSDITEYLSMASSETDRIARLVSNLRDIYRPAKEEPKRPLDLLKVLSEVRALLEPHLTHQNVTWQQAETTGQFWIDGLPDQVKQVFLNISLNAIEAMQPDGGMIYVTTTLLSPQNEVSIAFKDTGPGIHSEDLTKLFEPFFTTKSTGTGLGLTICYEIIQRHEGKITVESQPGKGATFTINLPLLI